MRIRYETGIATFIQFIVGVLLSILTNGVGAIGECRSTSAGECVSNLLVSLILIIIITVWLGFLLLLGYAAQDRRSPRLAMILMGAEAFAALIYLFDAKHAPDWLSRATNFISFLIAAWIIFLAWRLVRAKGGRIVHRQHSAARKPQR